MLKGIDVSQWQGDIDFAKVKSAGIDFVIIRAGYGKLTSQKDPKFEQNYSRAKATGLDVGVYWYSNADSVASAKQEAQACISVIKGKQYAYPIYFDLEEQSQFAKGRDFCDSIIKAFCTEIENAGYYAGLYMSRSSLQSYISQEVANRYALWIAEYNSKCNYSGEYGMWQYSSTGKVSGISGDVDMDYCYADYPSAIKKAGLNGYAKNTSSSAKTIKNLTVTIRSGLMTFDEYFAKVNGKGIDYDGAYGVMCFDLANDYCAKVLGGKAFIGMYAYEIYTNFANQPSAALFERIANTPDFVPKKGDIIVWAKSLNGTAGHVAVCNGEGDTSWFNSYDQNWTGRNDPCTLVKHNYNHVLGVLRPKALTSKASGGVLDTDGFKRGDKSLGVFALKRRLKAQGYSVDDTEGFGGGTEKAVNAVLAKWGYEQNGVAGHEFLKRIMK